MNRTTALQREQERWVAQEWERLTAIEWDEPSDDR
jgi:hypothetical protein